MKLARVMKGILGFSGLIMGLVLCDSAVEGKVLETGNQGSVSQEARPGPGSPAKGKAIPALNTPSSNGWSEDWWNRVQRGLAEGEYHASKNRHGLQAPNRAHNLRTYFESRGIRVYDRTATGQTAPTGLSLMGLGRGTKLSPVGEGTVAASGNRIEIRRPGVVEWYENSPKGLEQGFTLETRPPSEGPLVLELRVEGARANLAGKSVVLATQSGRKLHYGGLFAKDARGRTLTSRLEVPGPRRVRLVIEDAGAVYPLVIDPLLTSTPDTLLQSNQPDPVGFKPAAFGGSVSNAGDVNGDGFADVIVGAPGWDGGDPHEGAAFVFLGSATGIVGTDPLTAQAHIESNQFGAQLGTVSGSQAGDVNGDGFDDIIVGAHFYSDTILGGTLEVNGAAFVFLGSAAGIVGSDPLTAHAWIRANQLGSDLGLSVSGAGDINGDGFDDILVGAPKQGIPFPPNIPPNQGSGDGGAVLVFLGGVSGITGTGFEDADTVLLPYPPGSPVASQSFMGSRVSGAGDVNGDGFDDIILHAAGEAVVFLGSAAGIVGTDPASAHARIASDQAGTGLTSVSGAGDVNGDGFGDIIAGSPFYFVKNSTTQEGAAYVFLGSASGITATDTTNANAAFFGNLLGEWVGVSVSGAGDVDGDGFDDVLVGALYYPGSLNFEGVGYVFRGSATGIVGNSLSDAYARLGSNQSGATVLGNQVAFSVSGAGDVNGDGFADVIMGTGFYDAGQENEGAAFVYLGGPAPINQNQPPVANAGVNQVVIDIDNSGSETVTLDGSASFDPDGSIVSYQWLEGETVLGTSPVLTTDLTATGDHTLVLTVTDNAGLTRGDPVTVRVELVPTVQVAFDDFSTVDFGWTGEWISGGDALVSNFGSFPTPPQARLGASGAFMRRSANLPVGATGIYLSFWGKASQFGVSDQVLVKVSIDGGPFTAIETITIADSDNTYQAHILNFSWFPTTASNVVIEFESLMNTGLFFFDDVLVKALVAPTTNQNPIANAGLDQVITDTDNNGSETITVDGSASSDPDGSIVSFEWREGTTVLGTTALLTTILGVGNHLLTLTVTDNVGAVNSDTVSVSVVTPNVASNLAADDFESGNFSGGTGNWVGAWSNGGDVQITSNNGPHSGSNHVRLRKSNAFLRRTVNLLGASGVHLGYWGKANKFKGSDEVLVKVSIDGAPFTTVETITAAESDNTYRFHDIDLSGFSMTSNVRIEFDSNMKKGFFFIDDVEITGSVGPAPNQSPIANAGADKVVSDLDGNGLETVTLDGTGSSDPDGTIAGYQWSEGGTVIGNTSTVNASLGLGVHTISLTVTDNEGATASDLVTVTVVSNQNPVAAAGPDQSASDSNGDEVEFFTLDGSASSDPDGAIVSYEWREGAALLGTGATLGVSLGLGAHTVTLTVTDSGGATATDSAVLTVNPNESPMADAGADKVVTDTDNSGSEPVVIDGSASSDPDGSIVSYEWREGTVLLGTAAQLTTTLTIGDHNLTLMVIDNGGASASDTVLVTVTQAAAPPQGSVTLAGPSSVTRGNLASFTVTFTNTGTSTLTNVELSFNVSPDRRVRNFNPGSPVAAADVPPGGSVSQTWTGEADKEGPATAAAEAFSGGVSMGTAAQTVTVLK